MARLTLDDSDMLSMLVTYRTESGLLLKTLLSSDPRNKYFAFRAEPGGMLS